MVYYFYAFGRVQETGCREVYFSVPTGNFGDIFAGFIAKQMGLPIRRLEFWHQQKRHSVRFVKPGRLFHRRRCRNPGPSMDIQLASNFERYLYYLLDCDSAKVRQHMTDFAATGKLDFDASLQRRVAEDFLSGAATAAKPIDHSLIFTRPQAVVADPHTAIGVKVGKEQAGGEYCCLATAHPAKFGAAPVQEAIGISPGCPTPSAVSNGGPAVVNSSMQQPPRYAASLNSTLVDYRLMLTR
ncbi:MAG: hypothetical protein R2864_04850 [Syntrophotaleaceae bacterium]